VREISYAIRATSYGPGLPPGRREVRLKVFLVAGSLAFAAPQR